MFRYFTGIFKFLIHLKLQLESVLQFCLRWRLWQWLWVRTKSFEGFSARPMIYFKFTALIFALDAVSAQKCNSNCPLLSDPICLHIQNGKTIKKSVDVANDCKLKDYVCLNNVGSKFIILLKNPRNDFKFIPRVPRKRRQMQWAESSLWVRFLFIP